jgi:hypothetical protein
MCAAGDVQIVRDSYFFQALTDCFGHQSGQRA